MTTDKPAYHHGDLRAALITAAVEVIDELGPRGLRIREVARRAGVSHAAPYRHFADKNELILAVVEHGFDLLDQEMRKGREAAGDDPLSQFAASGEAYLAFALGYPAYYRVMFSGDLLNTQGNETLRNTSNATFRNMVEDIKTGQQLGVIREGDPLRQAIFIVSTVHGFVSLANDNRLAQFSEEGVDLDTIKDFVITSMFEGLGVR